MECGLLTHNPMIRADFRIIDCNERYETNGGGVANAGQNVHGIDSIRTSTR